MHEIVQYWVYIVYHSINSLIIECIKLLLSVVSCKCIVTSKTLKYSGLRRRIREKIEIKSPHPDII